MKKHSFAKWLVAGSSVLAVLASQGALVTVEAATHHVQSHYENQSGQDGSQQGQWGQQDGQQGQSDRQGSQQDQSGQSAHIARHVAKISYRNQGNDSHAMQSNWTSGQNNSDGQDHIIAKTSGNSASQGTPVSYTNASSFAVPPGVRLDPSIQPLAGTNASWQQKFDAVLQVAQSKLGTPYRWGHNEDRGQYGFDCSNFTAYVYHHALGYKMSGASRVQASSVGVTVPKQDMRPGDLLIDDNGRHVGIYIGNGRMIQEGGGLGKVGYLRVTPGSYWYNHITAVKRMF